MVRFKIKQSPCSPENSYDNYTCFARLADDAITSERSQTRCNIQHSLTPEGENSENITNSLPESTDSAVGSVNTEASAIRREKPEESKSVNIDARFQNSEKNIQNSVKVIENLEKNYENSEKNNSEENKLRLFYKTIKVDDLSDTENLKDFLTEIPIKNQNLEVKYSGTEL